MFFHPDHYSAKSIAHAMFLRSHPDVRGVKSSDVRNAPPSYDIRCARARTIAQGGPFRNRMPSLQSTNRNRGSRLKKNLRAPHEAVCVFKPRDSSRLIKGILGSGRDALYSACR